MRIFRIGLAITFLAVSAQVAGADPVVVGDHVTFLDGAGDVGGGEFLLMVNGDPSRMFATFCLQMTKLVDYSTQFVVSGISDYATWEDPLTGGDGNGRDFISSQTAWLYTQFRNHTLDGYDGSNSAGGALQWAFWVLEGEASGLPDSGDEDLVPLATHFIALANEAVKNGFTGIGDVKVLNLTFEDGRDAQDQLALVPTPEPASLMLLGTGLVALGFNRRRLLA